MNPTETHPPRTHRSRRSFQRTLDSAKRTMVFSEIVRLAVDSFKTSKVRFALTALGMVIGSASVILVATIGLTGKQYILDELSKIGTNMVDLGYTGGGSAGNVTMNNDFLTREDELAVQEQVPSVAYSSPLLQTHDRISFGGGVVKDVLVLGVSPEYKNIYKRVVLTRRSVAAGGVTEGTDVRVETTALHQNIAGGADGAIN